MVRLSVFTIKHFVQHRKYFDEKAKKLSKQIVPEKLKENVKNVEVFWKVLLFCALREISKCSWLMTSLYNTGSEDGVGLLTPLIIRFDN